MLKNIFIVITSFAAINTINAQTSYFPAGTEYIRHTPSAAPNNIIVGVEQRGLISYKGRSCDDSSMAFVSTADGARSYGDNQWMDVHVQIQHYKPDGKTSFDMIMQYNHPSVELNKKRDGFKTAVNPDGTPVNYILKIIDVPDGKMLIMNEHRNCVMTKYKEYTNTFFYSYAVTGTTIVWIDGGYNAAEPDLAIKTHSEIVEKIKKTGIN